MYIRFFHICFNCYNLLEKDFFKREEEEEEGGGRTEGEGRIESHKFVFSIISYVSYANMCCDNCQQAMIR